MLSKKCVLKIFAKFTEKHLQRPATLLKETTAHGLSCELSKIFKNTFSADHFRRTTSVFFLVQTFIGTELCGC